MSGAPLKRLADWTVRLGVPLAVLVTVLAVLLGEEMGIEHEVSLLTAPRAARGEPLPVRAIVLTGLDDVAGPELASLPVDVSLRALDGEVLLEQRLPASPAGGADGVVTIPSDAPDVVILRAIALIEDRGVASASRRFDLRQPLVAARLEGRSAHGTQHFSEGPLELTFEGPAPSDLTTRVVGGACAPETPCEVLVHVGAPAATVRFAPSAAVVIDVAPTEPTAGIARFVVTVRGPDAHTSLEALHDGVVVARRSVQLPVALAMPGLVVEERAMAPGASPTMRAFVLGDRPGVIVDLYARGHWTATSSVARSDAPFEAPVAVGPGLHRVQLHTDPFSSARAASRIVRSTDLDLAAALAELAAEGGDPVEAVPEGPAELRFAWAAAALEVGHYELPPPIRGYEQDRAALDARQRTLRVVALVAMGLGLLVLVFVFLRRGVGAALEAQRVMDATGDPELASDQHRRRTLLSALLLVATLMLAFLAAGAMIVVRARLLE